MRNKKNSFKRVAATIMAAILMTLPLGTTAFAMDDDPGADRLGSAVTESNTEDGIQLMSTTPFYSVDMTHNSIYDDCILLNGIDVSKYQGDIDWAKAKAAGVDFAFIRVGYRGYGSGGNFGADTYYDQNMQGAIEQGIPVGVYIFSQAITEDEAIEEANYILDRIGSYKISMPLIMDFEYASANGSQTGRLLDANLSQQEATNICLAFAKTIKAAGYTPMIYANYTMLTKGLYADQISSSYDIWLANYTNETSYTGDYSFWQYTSKGSVDGISGNVDCNFWYKKTPDKVTGLTSTDQTDSSISLSWKTATGAQGYQIYRSTTKDGSYERVASVSGEAITTYVDTSVSAGKAYYYKVRAYLKFSGTNYFGSFSAKKTTNTLPKTPSTLSSTANSTTSATLSWNKVSSADGYRIYQYNESTGKYVKYKTLSGSSNTSLSIPSLTSGTTYSYKVKAYKRINDNTYFSKASASVEVASKLSKVTDLTAGGKTASRIRLNWSKVTGADGYQIYYYDSTAKKYVKLTTITDNTLTYICTGLDSNTNYQFKVRAYQKINGTNSFGAFSTVLTVKTKK